MMLVNEEPIREDRVTMWRGTGESINPSGFAEASESIQKEVFQVSKRANNVMLVLVSYRDIPDVNDV